MTKWSKRDRKIGRFSTKIQQAPKWAILENYLFWSPQCWNKPENSSIQFRRFLIGKVQQKETDKKNKKFPTQNHE